MQVRISILRGKDAGQGRSYRIKPGERLVIGRSEECDLPLWDESASRRHAALENTSEGLFLRDLASSNGTRLNGNIVERVRIKGGERILIGDTEFRLETTEFHRRPTLLMKAEDRYRVESSLSRDAVNLGARIAADAGRQDRLNQLLRLVEELQAEESGEKILGTLLTQAVAALQPERGAIIPCASRSREALWGEAIYHPDSRPKLEVSRSMVERVLKEGDALQVSDARTDPRTRSRESIVSREVGSMLVAPISARDRIHGVLYLEGCQQAENFNEADLAYLATLGQVAGMALQSAERLQQSRRVLKTREMATPGDIITESHAFLNTIEHLSRFAASGGPLLIVGETGTGKELLARRAHREGPYSDGPWIPVNCAAIPSNLMESELFGHEKGAFTGATGRKAGMFELAHEGTLFLDEIGDLPLELQPKLLRVLETAEFFRIGGRAPVSVRLLVVSATHRDLEESGGSFREDLYFRISRFQVQVPPLSERPKDIVLLARHFLEQAGRRSDRPLELSSTAIDALLEYPWPGNVRELRNVLERAAVVATGDSVTVADLLLTRGQERSAKLLPPHLEGSPPSLEEVEEHAIRLALRHTGGKKGEAAQLLGIAWPTLRRKLRKYKIDPKSP